MLKVVKAFPTILSIIFLASCGDMTNVATVCVLRVTNNPNKITYNCGEDFDPTGATFEFAQQANLPFETVTDITYRDNKNLTHDQQYVYANYHGQDVRIPIEVSNVFQGQITCVGDSLTEGHYWPNQSYPNYIKNYFADSSLMTVVNCGKNGASFKTFGEYNPAYNTTSQYQTSLTGTPRVLTILLGTNDATNWNEEHDLYVQDYTNLVNTYRETFGDDLNIIMLTSPRCLTNTFGIPSDTICNEVVPLQKQLAEDLECYLIDLNSEFNNYTDSELFRPNDGVHFTEKAAQITAELIANKVKEIYSID